VVLIGLFILALLVTSLQPVFADATVGETVVTLGKDLTPSQRQAVLQEMGVDPNAVTIVEVTNDEEHRYLGNVLPKSAIGRRAISSAKITLEQPGSGVNVETHNITWVSESMYVNAFADGRGKGCLGVRDGADAGIGDGRLDGRDQGL
jgi:Predicted secreted protein